MSPGEICTLTRCAVKHCKHERTFIDDFWDAWDKMVCKLSCEKEKTKSEHVKKKKKSNDTAVASKISKTVVGKKLKDASKCKSIQTESKSDSRKSPRCQSPHRNLTFNEAKGTMTDASKKSLLSQANNNSPVRITSSQELGNMLRCIAKEQEKVAFNKALQELINQNNEAMNNEGEIKNEIQNLYLCPNCESRKKVKLCDSCTQYEELIWFEEYSGRDLGFSGIEDDSSPAETDFWNIYSNYKETYKTCYKPLQKTPSTREEIPMPQPKRKYDSNSPEFYQKKLAKAYSSSTTPFAKSSTHGWTNITERDNPETNVRLRAASSGKSLDRNVNFENSGNAERKPIPKSCRKNATQLSPSPCRDQLQLAAPFSNYYCSVAAMKGLPETFSTDPNSDFLPEWSSEFDEEVDMP